MHTYYSQHQQARGQNSCGAKRRNSVASTEQLAKNAASLQSVLWRGDGLPAVFDAGKKKNGPAPSIAGDILKKRAAKFSACTGPGIRYRMPTSAHLQELVSSGIVDEEIIYSRVRRLLERMNKEGHIISWSTVDVDVIMDEIFIGSGMIDQVKYENYLDPDQRAQVYRSVFDAFVTPRVEDQGKLQSAMKSVAGTAQEVSGDAEGLQAVFGSKWDTAQQNYTLIHDQLNALSEDIEGHVTTDYNLDAQIVRLDGWANFKEQHLHLLSDVVSNPESVRAKTTLVHETSHLAKEEIDDHGYYGSEGFVSVPEEIKYVNAAHYEELPLRVWGASKYPNVVFTPGVDETGEQVSLETEVRHSGVNYLRKAWDAAVDVENLLKSARWDQLSGLTVDQDVLDRLLEVSPLMDLTLHEQQGAAPNITQLDVTTSESVARIMILLQMWVMALPFTPPLGPFESHEAEVEFTGQVMIDQAIEAYGALLDDPVRDRLLVDWLFDNYRNI